MSLGELTFVAGAPRANHTGAVVLLKKDNVYRLVPQHIFWGEELASSFGYSVATTDLNKDGWEVVLLVGNTFVLLNKMNNYYADWCNCALRPIVTLVEKKGWRGIVNIKDRGGFDSIRTNKIIVLTSQAEDQAKPPRSRGQNGVHNLAWNCLVCVASIILYKDGII